MTECEKMLAVHEESQSIGEFLGWLQTEKKVMFHMEHKHKSACCKKGENVCGWQGQCGYLHASIDQLLAEYFKIDLKKVEQERRQLLKEIRKVKK